MATAESRSLYWMAVREAAAFRAERARIEGKDPGRDAVRQWNREHWWNWCGERLREHLRGETHWEEFGPDFFNILNRTEIALDEATRRTLSAPPADEAASIHNRMDDLLRRLEEALAKAGVGSTCRDCGRTFLRPKARPEEAAAAASLCPDCRAKT